MSRKLYALAAVMALAAPARADFTIDDFLSAPQSATVATTGSNSSTTAAPVLGGTRTLNLTVSTNPLNTAVTAEVSDAGGEGYFIYSSGPQAVGSGSIVYDAGGAGLGGVDLVQYGSAFAIDIVYADFGVTLGIEVTDTFGVTKLVQAAAAASGVITFDFGQFTGVDLTSLDSVSVVYSAPQSADFVLDFLGVTGNVPAVPEPASVALMGLGMVGAVAAARRRTARA